MLQQYKDHIIYMTNKIKTQKDGYGGICESGKSRYDAAVCSFLSTLKSAEEVEFAKRLLNGASEVQVITDTESVYYYDSSKRLIQLTDFSWSSLSETTTDVRILSDGLRVRGLIKKSTYGEYYDQESGEFGDMWERIECYAVKGLLQGNKVIIDSKIKIQPRHISVAFPSQKKWDQIVKKMRFNFC